VTRIAEVSGWLRERCEEAGRPFEAIRRTVTMDVVVRDTPEAATAAYAAVAAAQGMPVERAGSDDTERGLNAGGPPDRVAAYIRRFADLGIAEVMWVFRSPWDLETIRRVGEVRSLVR
jgi:alkanesulfonate monooxygenase SsuD/methylene tetrahydromethanopterin reductase-like flavin-dependent oxidoreductase (luciferase family)